MKLRITIIPVNLECYYYLSDHEFFKHPRLIFHQDRPVSFFLRRSEFKSDHIGISGGGSFRRLVERY